MKVRQHKWWSFVFQCPECESEFKIVLRDTNIINIVLRCSKCDSDLICLDIHFVRSE